MQGKINTHSCVTRVDSLTDNSINHCHIYSGQHIVKYVAVALDKTLSPPQTLKHLPIYTFKRVKIQREHGSTNYIHIPVVVSGQHK